MPTEPDADATADEETPEDTSDDSGADEQEDTPDAEQPSDWETRYKKLNEAYGRQSAELGILRRGGDDTDEAGDEVDDEPDDSGDEEPRGNAETGAARLERDSWALAESRYGAEAIEAYAAAHRILSRAETPADHIAAFEAYYDIRSQGGSKKEATAAATGAKQSRDKATQPRVDLNRSDASPDPTDLDNQLEGAKAKGDLKSFVHAATSKMGFANTSKR